LSQAVEWALWHHIKLHKPNLSEKPGTIKGLLDHYTGQDSLCATKLSPSHDDVDFANLKDKKWQLTNCAKHHGGEPDLDTQKWYAKEARKFIQLYIDPVANLRTIAQEMELSNDTWGAFYAACDKFKEEGRNLILAIGDISEFDSGYLAQLALPKWNLIIDYDYYSESNGFFKKVYANEPIKPNVIKAADVISNDDISEYSRTHYHFFANNFDGTGFECEHDFSGWDKRYGGNAEAFLKSFGSVFCNQKNIVIILHKDRRHVNFLCEKIQRYFDGETSFIIANDFENSLINIRDDFNATKIDISIREIIDGLRDHSSNFTLGKNLGDRYFIPYIDKTETATSGELSLEEYARLEECFEVLHINLPEHFDQQQPIDFLSGKERISWEGLRLSYDVEPKDFDRVYIRKVSEAFANTRGKLLLLHEPGYGGSTISRRIAWHFHTEYPTLILKKYSEGKVRDLIVNIHEKTRKTVFVIMEIPQAISQDEANILFASISRPVVFLTVKRGKYSNGAAKDAPLCVTDWGNDIQALTHKYIPYLKEKYREGSAPYNTKLAELEKLTRSTDPDTKTPFYVGLVTFEQDFKGIESYISNFVADIQKYPAHKRLISYLALCDKYLGMGLPTNILRSVVKADSEGVFELEKYFEGNSFITSNLLFCDVTNPRNKYWKIRHSFFSKELLKQLLGGGYADPDQWKSGLADMCESFIEDTAHEAESSDYLHDILQKLFIGTNTDRLGEQFTILINDMTTAEGKEGIFKKLTDLYPNNPHYCSHLARLYAYDSNLRNTEKAIELADRALTISERVGGRKDHFLYHTKGMCLRSNVYEKIDIQLRNIHRNIPVEQDEYDNIIFNLIPRTETQFEISRKIASDQNKSDEYGFVAHIQLLVRAIDFGAKIAGKPIQEFITKDNHPFSEWIDLAETLLSEVKRISVGDDRHKINECENDILAFYGQYSKIIQNLHNILDRSQKPTIIYGGYFQTS